MIPFSSLRRGANAEGIGVGFFWYNRFMIFNLYKQRGETPLECVQRFRDKFPEHDKKKPLEKGRVMRWTYMGRLDPMAEGVMLVANGEDVLRKQEFLDLDKDYDFVSIFGFSTDTYDVLGKVLKVSKVEDLKEMDLIKICKLFEGEREQKYPEYSSKIIAKKRKVSQKKSSSESPRISLLAQARLSSQDFSETPEKGDEELTKKITVFKMQFHGLDELKSKELFGRLLMDIAKVKGDFRQNETLILWRKMLEGYKQEKLYLGRFSATVSSGTYIRGLVNDMGVTLGINATTLSIRRTRVGDYKVEDSIKF